MLSQIENITVSEALMFSFNEHLPTVMPDTGNAKMNETTSLPLRTHRPSTRHRKANIYLQYDKEALDLNES